MRGVTNQQAFIRLLLAGLAIEVIGIAFFIYAVSGNDDGLTIPGILIACCGLILHIVTILRFRSR